MRKSEIRSAIPEYGQLQSLLSETSAKLITVILSRPSAEERAEKLKKLENDNLSIQKNMEELLKTAGYPADYLDPIYTCKVCNDKGSVDGKWCECYQRLMLKAAAEEMNSVSPLKLSSFDGFSLEYYSEENDPQIGNSPKTVMKHNLESCKKYAEEFDKNSESLLLVGATGLGKTHLSLAIANRIMERGFNAVYCSAPEVMRTLEKEYFGKSDANTMELLTQCDLLILDDLGAEMAKPLYESLMYEIINARINRNIPIVTNTNLTIQQLRERYQDRVCSRLISFRMLMFFGSDIRRKVKK